MKRIMLWAATIALVIVACRTIEPIDPTYTYLFDNQSDKDLSVVYYTKKYVDTVSYRSFDVQAGEIKQFPIARFYGAKSLPSLNFDSIVISSDAEKTCINPVVDTQWKCDTIVEDHGYLVISLNWTLKYPIKQ